MKLHSLLASTTAIAAALATISALAAVVGPKLVTRVATIDDGYSSDADMSGPVNGSVTYLQDSSGQLIVKMSFTNASAPNTSYDANLVCGASHDLSCGNYFLGTLTSNSAGRASGTFVVPNGVFGEASYNTNHIDVVEASFTYSAVAGAINYYDPGAGVAAAAVQVGEGDLLKR